MTRILEVVDLRVSVPVPGGAVHAVRGLDLHLDAGEILGVVGESGCGKSLTSLALMGLLPRHARREVRCLRFAGVDISSYTPRQMSDLCGNRMTMIFQEPMTSLNPVLTIGEQLQEVYRRHRPGDRAGASARAVSLLDRVGVPAAADRMRQYPHQLSGGLRQRVMIAMALMCEPELIICDEPTTALDVTIQAQVLRLLQDLQREFGMAVMLITHDLGVVARMADRTLVMYAGQALECGPTREVFERPRHPYTRGLLSCIPGRSNATEVGRHLGTIPGSVPTAYSDPTACSFAPRCPLAFDDCLRAPVPMQTSDGGVQSRCLLRGTQP